MANTNIEKIYDVKTLGSDRVIADLGKINQLFVQIRKEKMALNNLKATVEDPGQLAAIAQKLQELALREAELKVKKAEAEAQAKTLQAIRQQEINDQKVIGAGNTALSGSYNKLKADIRELYNAVKAAPKGSTIALKSGDLVTYDQAIAKLKQLTATEQDFRRQFQRDKTLVGEYTTGIIQAFQKMGLGDLIKSQTDKARASLVQLEAEFQNLTGELRETQATGNTSLEALEARLIENRNAAAQTEQQLRSMQAAIAANGNIGQQVTRQLAQGFSNLRTQVGQLVLGYVGLQAALFAIPQAIERTKELSDQTTGLEIELDKAAGGANNLVDALAGLDTRTKLVVLEEIANIAARAGTAEENLAGVTAAIDKIKVAFGKDFGDVEEGTEALVKIINIFEGSGNVTGDNLLRTGNAIRTLANESVASVPFINDFTKRMAGLKGTFDISLPSVLGLSAGFENFGQSAEVSSTALVKIIPKLASDVEKFAAIAGVTKQEFSQLINENPAEAFLAVAQALVKTTGGVEAFSTAFADSELGSGRIASIVGVAGDKANIFRQKIALAGNAILDTANIEDAFAKKNENLAATLDKISKKFADGANSKGFQLTITAIAGVISLLINNMGIIIGLLGIYGTILGVANAAQIKLWVSTKLANIEAQIDKALSVARIAYTEVYAAVVLRLSIAQSGAAASATVLRVALSALGIGAVIALVAVLVGVFDTARAGINGTTDALRANAKQMQIDLEIRKRARDSVSESIAKLEVEKRIIESTATSMDTKREALNRLIALYPAFGNAINGQKIKLGELRTAYQQVTDEIYKQAEAQAAAGLVAEEQKKVLQLVQLRQKIETQAANTPKGGLLGSLNLSDEEKDLLLGNKPFLGIRAGKVPGALLTEQYSGAIQFQLKDISKITSYLNTATQKQQTEYQQYVTTASKKQAELDVIRRQTEVKRQASAIEQANSEKLTSDQLSAMVTSVDEQIKKLQEGDPKIKELLSLRAQYNKRLEAFDDPKKDSNKTPGTSKLSVDQQDRFKEIEASQKDLITALEQKYAAGKVEERNYVLALQKINDDAALEKIAKVQGKGAEEQRVRADLNLKITQDQKKLNEQLYKLDLEALNAEKEANEREARKAARLPPDSTELQKAESQQVYFDRLLVIQKEYEIQAEGLEKFYNQESLKNTEARADAVEQAEDNSAQQRLETKRRLEEKLSKAVDQEQNSQSTAETYNYENQRAEVFGQKFASAEARNRKFRELELAHQQRMLDIEQAGLLARKQLNDNLFLSGTLSAEEYAKRKEQIDAQIAANTAKYGELSARNQEESFRRVQDSLSKFAAGIQQVYDRVIGPLMDLEKQDIEQQLSLQQEQIEKEKEQRLATAQSKSEEDAINKEAAAKKKDAEKKAFEEKKKLALAELAIQSAIAAIRAFATAPDYVTGAIEAGLIGVQYLIQRKKIEQQKFARGGSIPTRGGTFDGPSHDDGGIPTRFGEFEGDELAIINKHSAASRAVLNVTGTPKQIASALNKFGGGIDFAGGASMRKFAAGGYIGSSVQPPVFRSYFTRNSGESSADLAEIKAIMRESQEMMRDTQALVYSESVKPVQLNPHAVTEAQNDQRKNVNLATT
jgi:hypothetical protein